MGTYFHVASSSYRVGQPVYCYDKLTEFDQAPEWKWEGEPFDTDVVCMFATEGEAREAIEDGILDGPLLRIEAPDDAYITHVLEGFPAIFSHIPAEWISVA